MEKIFSSTKKGRHIYHRGGPVGPPPGTDRVKQHLCMKLNYFLISVPGANGGTGNGTGPGGKLVSGDLDASLANLTSNLNLGAGQAK